MTISEKLSETIAQKERIASEVNSQTNLISQIKEVLQEKASGEVPKSKLASLVDRSITEITEEDFGNATVIQMYQFYMCSNLKSLVISNTIKSINTHAFYKCENLTNFVFPNSITSLMDNAFYGCNALTSIEIPSTVTSIGDYCFYNCKNVSSLILNEGLEKIGAHSLRGNKVNSVVIPSTVTSMGQQAFYNGGTIITMLSTTPPSIYSATFNASNLQNIIVPKGYGDTYKAATNWSSFADYIIESET